VGVSEGGVDVLVTTDTRVFRNGTCARLAIGALVAFTALAIVSDELPAAAESWSSTTVLKMAAREVREPTDRLPPRRITASTTITVTQPVPYDPSTDALTIQFTSSYKIIAPEAIQVFGGEPTIQDLFEQVGSLQSLQAFVGDRPNVRDYAIASSSVYEQKVLARNWSTTSGGIEVPGLLYRLDGQGVVLNGTPTSSSERLADYGVDVSSSGRIEGATQTAQVRGLLRVRAGFPIPPGAYEFGFAWHPEWLHFAYLPNRLQDFPWWTSGALPRLYVGVTPPSGAQPSPTTTIPSIPSPQTPPRRSPAPSSFGIAEGAACRPSATPLGNGLDYVPREGADRFDYNGAEKCAYFFSFAHSRNYGRLRFNFFIAPESAGLPWPFPRGSGDNRTFNRNADPSRNRVYIVLDFRLGKGAVVAYPSCNASKSVCRDALPVTTALDGGQIWKRILLGKDHAKNRFRLEQRDRLHRIRYQFVNSDHPHLSPAISGTIVLETRGDDQFVTPPYKGGDCYPSIEVVQDVFSADGSISETRIILRQEQGTLLRLADPLGNCSTTTPDPWAR
jgi:hypothetical protein